MKLIHQLWGIAILSLTVAIAFFISMRSTIPTGALISISLMAAQGVMTLGAAWFFIRGLYNFQPKLRKAYRLLCIGAAAFGLSQSQFTLVSLLNAYWWNQSGAFTLPYLLSFIFFFAGMRQFAKTLEIKTRWASWRWALVSCIGSAAIVIFIPYAPKAFPFAQHAITVGFLTIDAMFFLFCTAIALRIKREIGPLYTGAIASLATGLAFAVFGAVHYIVVEIAIRVPWYYQANYSSVPLFIASCFILYAGYSIRQLNEIPAQYVPRRNAGEPVRFVDIVIYAAGLASQPRELTEPLNDLRALTAQLSPGDGLSATEEQRVIMVYRKVEDYLVRHERLRLYSQSHLQTDIIKKFQLDQRQTARLWPAAARQAA